MKIKCAAVDTESNTGNIGCKNAKDNGVRIYVQNG